MDDMGTLSYVQGRNAKLSVSLERDSNLRVYVMRFLVHVRDFMPVRYSDNMYEFIVS